MAKGIWTHLSSLLSREYEGRVTVPLWTHRLHADDGTNELSLGDHEVSNVREDASGRREAVIESIQVRTLSGTILEMLFQTGGWIEKLQGGGSTITSLRIQPFAETHGGSIDTWRVELEYRTPEDPR